MKDAAAGYLVIDDAPLASATGYVTIIGSVSFAAVFVWWLLRAEARRRTADGREEEEAAMNRRSGERISRTVTVQPSE